jgi:hypothetical protein
MINQATVFTAICSSTLFARLDQRQRSLSFRYRVGAMNQMPLQQLQLWRQRRPRNFRNQAARKPP